MLWPPNTPVLELQGKNYNNRRTQANGDSVYQGMVV